MSEVSKRRTFAIISHPDAGKTTVTEKLLLYAGAIKTAGSVKARKASAHATSDWMEMEKERGISITSSIMQFDYDDHVINLLDTPGHEDFSEDTYRTLTAVDSALMVIDVAKGVEMRTIKLMEVCRLRDTPILTFINKLDREGKEPIDLMDEVETVLNIECAPITWPIGMGKRFKGVVHLLEDKVHLYEAGKNSEIGENIIIDGVDNPKLDEILGKDVAIEMREEVELIRETTTPFDLDEFLSGKQTPVFFGSAISNFGIQNLLDGFIQYAPTPKNRESDVREVKPDEEKLTGFVFKIQANMDPKHRDRIAFFRLSSGHFKRGMKLKHIRSNKMLNLHNPVLFLAQDRETAEEAYAGDIIGIPNHGNLRIGDALTEGEELHFTGIPSFAPELLQTVRPEDPMKAKHLGRALQQLAEEGAARVFKPRIGADWIVGVVGSLQFEVMADRIRTEYEVPVIFESTSLYTARWIEADDPQLLKKFIDENSTAIADDHNQEPVFLARNAWHLDRAGEDFPNVQFLKTKEQIG